MYGDRPVACAGSAGHDADPTIVARRGPGAAGDCSDLHDPVTALSVELLAFRDEVEPARRWILTNRYRLIVDDKVTLTRARVRIGGNGEIDRAISLSRCR